MAPLKIPEIDKSYNFPSPKLEYLLRVFEGFPNGIFFDQVKWDEIGREAGQQKSLFKIRLNWGETAPSSSWVFLMDKAWIR